MSPPVLELCFVFLASCLWSHALCWPSVELPDSDRLPKLQVSLAPPVHPLPKLARAVGDLEASREAYEESMMNKLQSVQRDLVASTRAKTEMLISRVVDVFADPSLSKALALPVAGLFARRHREIVGARADMMTGSPSVSFIQQAARAAAATEKLSVKVRVATASGSSDGVADLRAVELKRVESEQAMFDTLSADLKELADYIVGELEAQLQEQLNQLTAAAGVQEVPLSLAKNRGTHLRGFLADVSHHSEIGKAPPLQANIRVVPSDSAYPTVSSMGQDMSDRRDVAENLVVAKVNMMKLDLAKTLVAFAQETLRAALSRF